MRTEDIEKLDGTIDAERLMLVATDGPTGYMRPVIDSMDDDTFALYMRYHFAVCERSDPDRRESSYPGYPEKKITDNAFHRPFLHSALLLIEKKMLPFYTCSRSKSCGYLYKLNQNNFGKPSQEIPDRRRLWLSIGLSVFFSLQKQ